MTRKGNKGVYFSTQFHGRGGIVVQAVPRCGSLWLATNLLSKQNRARLSPYTGPQWPPNGSVTPKQHHQLSNTFANTWTSRGTFHIKPSCLRKKGVGSIGEARGPLGNCICVETHTSLMSLSKSLVPVMVTITKELLLFPCPILVPGNYSGLLVWTDPFHHHKNLWSRYQIHHCYWHPGVQRRFC